MTCEYEECDFETENMSEMQGHVSIHMLAKDSREEPHPNALAVEDQAESWQCWNLTCLSRSRQADALCYNCGNPRGYLDLRVKQLLKAHTEALLSAVETVIGEDEHIQHFSFHGRSDIRDELRREQHQALNKLKERYQPQAGRASE